MSKRSLLTVFAVAAALMLGGCAAAPNIDEYSSVRAVLDPLNVVIEYPLDEYALNGREAFEVQHANALLVADCMAEYGFDYPRTTENWDTKPVPQERRYGLWSAHAAEAYAYEYPSDPTTVAIDGLEMERSELWWSQVYPCINETKQLPAMTVHSSEQQSPVDRVMDEANANMRSSDEYRESWQEWATCIEERGLSAQREKAVLIPELPESAEERAKMALIDIACKQENNSIQRIADIEARFQAAYIDQRESELNAYRQEADDVLEQAREIIATHGG